MIRRPPRSTQSRSSAASDVYKRQKGQIATDGSTVELFDFRSSSTTLHEAVAGATSAGEGHAGGDVAMIKAFVRALCDGEPSHFSSDGRASLATHEIVFAAEEARLRGTVVSLA